MKGSLEGPFFVWPGVADIPDIKWVKNRGVGDLEEELAGNPAGVGSVTAAERIPNDPCSDLIQPHNQGVDLRLGQGAAR